MQLKWNITGLDGAASAAVREVLPLLGATAAADGLPVDCGAAKEGEGLCVRCDGSRAEIRYSHGVGLFRGLGLLAEMTRSGAPGEKTERPLYDDLGIMLDCSRGAVPTFESYCAYIRRMALMGYTSLQLYTEDTYEVPEYPYFGYLRGRFSQDDLRRMDDYAAQFSIELVPCIQTLAHLGNFLRWPEAAKLRDFDDIILAGDGESYKLIEAMIRSMAGTLRSRRINLGMDEAHMVGLGRYLDQHGYRNRPKIILEHLNRVLEITRRYGYKPMMWSDMFFRLACGGDYYRTDFTIDPEIIASIPKDLTLVYWDYYNTDASVYDRMMKKHRELCPRLAFAGGAWNWIGYSPCSHFSQLVGNLAHSSCKENGVREALITIWGDNGAESSRFAVLPALQQWAEMDWADRSDDAYLAGRFATCCGGDYSAFMRLDEIVLTPGNPAPGRCSLNLSKPLLYQDILAGIFDRQIPEGCAAHYAKCAALFDTLRGEQGDWSYLFETQYRFARVLELKAEAGIQIRAAYKEGDRETLRRYAEELLPELERRIQEFIEVYRRQWFAENRAQGYNVLDIRFGALLQRARTARESLAAYLGGKIAQIELLEDDLLPFIADKGQGPAWTPHWDLLASAQLIGTI